MRRHGVRRSVVAGVLALSMVWVGCRPGGPQQIHYGEDVCEHCQMTIMDRRYGAQLITTRGRVLKFDAVECLAAYYLGMERDQVASLWVTDFASPESFVPAGEASYLRSEVLRSPMGLGLTAFAETDALQAAQSQYSGEPLDWQGVLDLVEETWLREGGPPPHRMQGALPTQSRP